MARGIFRRLFPAALAEVTARVKGLFSTALAVNAALGKAYLADLRVA